MEIYELFLSILKEKVPEISETRAQWAYELSVSNIKNYTRTINDVEDQFPTQIVSLALHLYESFGREEGISSFTQGNRSVTYSKEGTSSIPKHIKDTLPRFIRFY